VGRPTSRGLLKTYITTLIGGHAGDAGGPARTAWHHPRVVGTSAYDDIAGIYDKYVGADGAADSCLDFYARQVAGTAGLVLELGVGTGRVGSMLATAGADVVGLDASSAMLAKARAHPTLQDRLVEARFPHLPFRRAFEAVICPLSTVGHTVDEADCLQLFRSVATVLRPGGRFLFDHYNLDAAWAPRLHGTKHVMYSGPDPEDESATLRTSGRLWLRAGDRVMRQVIRVERLDADGRWSSRTTDIHTRWYSEMQYRHFADEAGLRVQALYGGFSGTSYTKDSSHMVWVLATSAAVPDIASSNVRIAR
jgi:SAM-dependent methyltransferase